MFRYIFACLIIFAAALLPGVSFAAPIATAVQVTGNAELSSGGQRFIIRSGARIEEGATITTEEGGIVQLTFDDGTNMVVGENSTLEITAVLMGSGNRASRFAVNAVAGSFRFISGSSPREVYEITTPTATMGVRGTEFDLAVTRRDTALALFSGTVQMCRGNSGCATVRGSCAVARTQGLGGISGVGGQAAAEVLSNSFPLVSQQSGLNRQFRVNADGCDRYFVTRSGSTPIQQPRAVPTPPVPEPPTPQPPEPPAPPPPPEPQDPNFPGNSGSTGPSEGRGGGVSGGQNGSGTGSGQGATNGNRGGNTSTQGEGGGNGNGQGGGGGNGNAGWNGRGGLFN